MDIDLNIDNYKLQDLLNLFQLNKDFNLNDLKNAKKIALKTHPDKSKLPKEYFLFFVKALKILNSIYEFRNNTNKDTEYKIDRDEETYLLIKNIKDSKKFNKIFNQMFEELCLEENKGYGEWFSSDKDINDDKINKNDMNQYFLHKKDEARGLIKYNNIEDFSSALSTCHNFDEKYSDIEFNSDLFSSLPYNDLKKVFTETVIPVTDKDMQPTYSSLQELQVNRNKQNLEPLSNFESLNFLKHKEDEENNINIQRAYRLAREQEHIKEINNIWNSKFKQINN